MAKITLRKVRKKYKNLKDAIRAEKCKDYGYYVDRYGMSHLQWRLFWDVSASNYYR